MSAKEPRVCTRCQGSGKCYKCGGTGRLRSRTPAMNVHLEHSDTSSPLRTGRTCSECMGSGTCQGCKGTGKPPA